jgi:hypothetical protein
VGPIDECSGRHASFLFLIRCKFIDAAGRHRSLSVSRGRSNSDDEQFHRRNQRSVVRSHRCCAAVFKETVARPSAERCDAGKCCITNAMAFSSFE